jgi:hypothetical protein
MKPRRALCFVPLERRELHINPRAQIEHKLGAWGEVKREPLGAPAGAKP